MAAARTRPTLSIVQYYTTPMSRRHTDATSYARDFTFDDEVPERPAADRANFADIRPLADLEARRQRWAREFDQRAASALPRK